MLKVCIIFTLLICSQVIKADERKLKEIIETIYPEYKVDNIAKTSYANLYEIFINNQIVYCDADFTFLIVSGRLIDFKSFENITTSRQKVLSAQLKASATHLEFEEGSAFSDGSQPVNPVLRGASLREKCLRAGHKLNSEKFKKCMAI
ncbi:Disulphide bond isomerase, DsbC/G, N-terminal [Methylophilaceae bacterium]